LDLSREQGDVQKGKGNGVEEKEMKIAYIHLVWICYEKMKGKLRGKNYEKSFFYILS